MKTTHTAPAWSIQLVQQVCADYKRALPDKLSWYDKNRVHTSGHTKYARWHGLNQIHISAGKDEWEHRVVVLHELAHHIMGKTRKGTLQGHSLKFWRLLFDLAINYGNVDDLYKRDIELAQGWRPGTRKLATVAYDELPK